MGNAPPVPASNPHPGAGRPSGVTGEQHQQQHQLQQKNAVGGRERVGAGAIKPPVGWSKESDEQDFILVSPQSDLSNPSQFRHRIVNTKTPIQDRKRTSKVISKEIPRRCQTYVRSNTLPAPQAFYFERHIRDHDDDNDDDLNHLPRRPTPAVPRVSAADAVAGAHGGEKENDFAAAAAAAGGCANKKNWTTFNKNRVKEKASRAKRMLKGCWDEQKEQMQGCIIVVHEKATAVDHHHHEQQRKTTTSPIADPIIAVNASNNNNNKAAAMVAAAQFSPQQPGIPQQVVFHPYHQQHPQDMTQLTQTVCLDEQHADHRGGGVARNSTYLHDERNYVDRLVARAAVDQDDDDDQAKENRFPAPRPHAAKQQQHPAVSNNNNNINKHLQEEEVEDRIIDDSPVVAALFDTTKKQKGGKAMGRSKSSSPVAKQQRKKKSNSSAGVATATTNRTSISEAIQAQIDAQLQRNRNSQQSSSSQRVSIEKNHREPLAQKKDMTKVYNKESNATRGRLSSREGELKRRSASSLICRSKAVGPARELQEQEEERCLQTTSKSMQSEARRVSLEKADMMALDSPDTYSSGSTLYSKSPSGEKENFYRLSGKIYNDRRTSLATSNNSLTGASVSDMLIQTYPIANAFIDPRVRYSTARYLTGNNYTKLEEETDPANSGDHNSSPALDTVEGARLTPPPMGKQSSPNPLLSEQVTTNAAFLFSPSYYSGDGAPKVIKPAPRNESTSFTISTTESRNRLSGGAWSSSHHHPQQQHHSSRPDTSTTVTRISIDEASYESDRRVVRFSGSDQVFPLANKEDKYRSCCQKDSPGGEDVYIPRIESKLSDLTDTTTGIVVPSNNNTNTARRESILSVASSMTTYSSKVLPPSIPEEDTAAAVAANDDDDEDDTTTTSTANEESCATKKSSPLPATIVHEPSPPPPPSSTDDNSTQSRVSEYCKSSTQGLHAPPPKKNWSYATGDNSMDNGVTPLRSGKSSNNATNSPYLRFNEAKNRFAGKNNNNTTTKIQPVKAGVARSVKKISAGLVQKRVVAMEEKVRHNVTITTTATRRDTIGHRAIAPRKGHLVSSTFRTNPPHVNPTPVEQKSSTATVFKSRSSLDDNNTSKPTNSLVTRAASATTSNDEAGFDTDATSDPYGEIMHSNPIDEESSDEEAAACDILQDVIAAQKTVASAIANGRDSTDYETEEDDDFAALLQYQSSSVDGDDEESYDEETVSTVRQQPRKIEYRSSSGSSSSSASTSVGPSVATIRQNRAPSLVSTSESTTLSRALKKENIALAFRHEAPVVKPNEQIHHRTQQPGAALCLSPSRRTPMQARKWRALAAAAQEKESKQQHKFGVAKASSSSFGGQGVLRKSLSERSNTMHNKYY